ncbi:hypothetical protein AGABI1DRAFT_62224 [Agaricus bisporus var. burnettii JB137-S8]|uniref:Major facilitator superfamily (MFS) profile domain-containing protein n=1 Tax=Agaricus bisporus var. burnettii (strain JB137-S8 / ATCC MYA-4627 / FGSC 10392) TaxID=597362 RepID=K5XQV4_AGABU|nr:uncharacterized protein AGABI1DRAFT_62224 [Agaricus bisporus var. burnettii JB137-S8]EKM77200.1 hypothetical protein AGABI1DRAFT_62224 [Agaricus bisporus var. burnettii JB137-S8]
MPILTVVYLVSFIDRGDDDCPGNAKLQGITTQLNLTGHEYNIALVRWNDGYCVFECPANLVLKRLRPSRWVSPKIIWMPTLTRLPNFYPQLVAVRFLLGTAEAGLFPGVVYYLSIWFPRHMLQYRIGIFYGAASMAGAFSGLLAYGIGFMSGTRGRLGWSWIFILEGIATVVVGFCAFFLLVDFPATSKFLTPDERSYVIWRKSKSPRYSLQYDNSSVGEEEHFEMRHFWAVISDWQLWLHILIYMSIVGPLYGITLFLPTIINSFGYSPAISQLLTVPPYVVATITMYLWGLYSDKIQKRSPFILAGLICCLIGYAINISNAPSGVKYFGTFFVVTGSYAAFPGTVAWLGNNLAGQYKRGIGMAIQIGVGNFSGAIASNIYRSQDSPRFLVGHGVELMFVGMGLICVPVAVLSYVRINKKRDELQREALEKGEANKYTPQQLREMGDREPSFRYTL